MTLHEAMPDYDVREYHQTVINASREEVYRTMKTMDFRASEIVRALLWIRSGGREAKAVTLETFWKRGFLLLSDVPNKEVLLAWWVVSGRPLVAFRRFHPTSSFPSKTFLIHDQPSGTLLTTETCVKCFRNREHIFFRCYWTVIRPFSGLIRKEMLRQIKTACESQNIKT